MAERDFHFYMDLEQVKHLHPQNGQLIVELRDDRGEHKGLFLPLTVNPLVPDRGVVVAVSDDLAYKDIVPGSKVLFERYMGKKIFTEERTFLIINQEHLLAQFPDDADIGIKYDCLLS